MVEPAALAERSDPAAHFARPGVLLLARLGPAVVGMAGVRALDGGDGDGGVAELARCFVLPAVRGTGLGRRLVGCALEVSRRRGVGRVELDVVPDQMGAAAGLSRSLGFEEVGRRPGAAPGAEVVRMAIDLGPR
jgi:ribosomal protein S18 acetylase RimI-like enzyme